MRIIGIGIDIIEIQDMEKLLKRSGTGFESRCFTAREKEAAGTGINRVTNLTAAFASKEAVLKALGTGWTQDISWTHVEIVSSASQHPQIFLYENAKIIALKLSITSWTLSISLSKHYVVANAIALQKKE
jgi:holo-[acyl-carrier protein] synthase